ncbi:MAG: CehA/McbA family metallohydrolase [Planctomycetota bacterium]|jgi:hypothetical protein|nr:CehA/McbA family metallohydrolase [Planctomycetota bacterium]MDP6764345.1 CehA/McbA family metallohydrolase [Planctomycetota bacterium]MDP6988695.1 CehA/McbA family metallohydrolase [Planctomycetota bacterium]
MNLLRPTALACGLALAATLVDQSPDVRVLDATHHHLGDDRTPEWPEASPDPEGTSLHLEFEGRAREGESVLWITQRSVDNAWHLVLNGERVGLLERGAGPVDRWYSLPGGTLVDGTNVLEITPEVPADDVVLGNFRLAEASLREVLRLQPVTLTVLDRESGRPLPCRLTLVREDGLPASLFYTDPATCAVRDGVAYTLGGRLEAELEPGRLTVYASRGTEWSVAEGALEVGAGGTELTLTIAHEVDTTGYVACDTHVHTLEFSGHGDASVHERVITLAGEGVELAIATDHNHNTDYRPTQQRLGLNPWFTAVTGNEVTTSNGHFNAFPLDPDEAVPDHTQLDWVKLDADIRSRGARTVILNHPRWPEDDSPFDRAPLDPPSGARGDGSALPFDAMELVNSDTGQTDPMELFRDWFGLLDRGESIMAVGASDSHTVSDTVGGGRTYVRSRTDEPARIDVEAACAAINAGHASVSHGIFVDLLAADGSGASLMGETVGASAGAVDFVVRVAAPSWARPESIAVFVNGAERARAELAVADGPVDLTRSFHIDLPAPHDAWIGVVVEGSGGPLPWWNVENPYTLAATNPLFVDRGGVRGYESPRATAERLIATAGSPPAGLGELLSAADDAVLIQALTLLDAEARASLDSLAGARAEHSERLRAFLAPR